MIFKFKNPTIMDTSQHLNGISPNCKNSFKMQKQCNLKDMFHDISHEIFGDETFIIGQLVRSAICKKI